MEELQALKDSNILKTGNNEDGLKSNIKNILRCYICFSKPTINNGT